MKKASKRNFKNRQSEVFMPFCAMIIGVALLFFGVKISSDINEKSKNYESVQGTFIQKEIYSSDENGDIYSLIYKYIVNDKEYLISTEGGISIVPPTGSSKTIKYNPSSPDEAIITAYGINIILIWFGIMFIEVSLIPIFRGKGSNSIRVRLSNINIALCVITVGCGVYYIVCSGTDSFSVIVALKSSITMTLLAIVFVLSGIYLTIKEIVKMINENLINK